MLVGPRALMAWGECRGHVSVCKAAMMAKRFEIGSPSICARMQRVACTPLDPKVRRRHTASLRSSEIEPCCKTERVRKSAENTTRASWP